jgi:hypothetical protein
VFQLLSNTKLINHADSSYENETMRHRANHTTTRITQSRYLCAQNEACQDALDRFDERFEVGE